MDSFTFWLCSGRTPKERDEGATRWRERGRATQAALGGKGDSPYSVNAVATTSLWVCVRVSMEAGREQGDVVSLPLIIQIISTQCRIFGKKQGARVTNNLVF